MDLLNRITLIAEPSVGKSGGLLSEAVFLNVPSHDGLKQVVTPGKA
jgi:hypothetical protein